MSGQDEWHDVPQTLRSRPAVRVSLFTMRGVGRLGVALPPGVLDDFGWGPGTRLALQVGQGAARGQVRLRAHDDGAPLRRLGRAKALAVMFSAGPLAAWQAPKMEAAWRRDGNAMRIDLPWTLPEVSHG